MNPKSKIASFFNAIFVNHRDFKLAGKVDKVVSKMNLSEKIFLSIFSLIFAISGIILLIKLNDSFLVEVPAFGGKFTEGVVGRPRFINPVLAVSDTDKDMVSLIYSGLLKTKEGGGFETDLAESFEIQEDGLVYDFILRDNAYFHDGKKVTTDDIIFTINKILDPVIKSPRSGNWEGVIVEKINDREIKFILKKPYALFQNALILGILPKHIWNNVSSEEFPFSEFNISPVGSGQYKIKKIEKNSGGIPTLITLESWSKYATGRPKIKNVIFKFFQNETELLSAYQNKEIDSVAGLSQKTAQTLLNNQNLIDKTPLPRVFGIFFNQNMAPVFLNKEVREALDVAAPRKKIIDEVLSGFGAPLNGPTPANLETDSEKIEGNIEAAKNELIENGWKANADGILEKKTKTGNVVLQFSISTSDVPELKKTAEILKESWEKLGASITIKIFEAGDLSQNVIKLRKYDALLFGEIINTDSDLFPFWHSSERNDPGLNISLYANIVADKALENIQKETNREKKIEEEETLFSEIKKDVPAVFLFSPYFIYMPAPKVKNIYLKEISAQNERFVNINDWFIETDKVWKIFAQN